jgi:predicted RNase H-like HicB family nuclease
MDMLNERVSIKFCWKLGKTTTETYKMLQQALEECVELVQDMTGSPILKTAALPSTMIHKHSPAINSTNQ